MEKKGWKILAIVFIVLFVIVTLSGLVSNGLDIITQDARIECINMCEDDFNAHPQFDIYSSMCYCFDDDTNLIKEILIE